MRSLVLLTMAGVGAVAFAQNPQDSSPAGGGQTQKMIGMAMTKAADAIREGKTVTITVDNRSTSYAPKVISGMVYVPIRLFQETGQQVVWDARNMRAILRSQNGPQKQSVVFDTAVRRRTNQPTPSMRPVYEGGRVWVPLAGALAPFGHMVEWVPTSDRLNIRTNRNG